MALMPALCEFPCIDPDELAIRMVISMCRCVGELNTRWPQRGHHLVFGMRTAQGYATLGKIGFEGALVTWPSAP